MNASLRFWVCGPSSLRKADRILANEVAGLRLFLSPFLGLSTEANSVSLLLVAIVSYTLPQTYGAAYAVPPPHYHCLYWPSELQRPTASLRKQWYNMARAIQFGRFAEQNKLLAKYEVDTSIESNVPVGVKNMRLDRGGDPKSAS